MGGVVVRQQAAAKSALIAHWFVISEYGPTGFIVCCRYCYASITSRLGHESISLAKDRVIHRADCVLELLKDVDNG